MFFNQYHHFTKFIPNKNKKEGPESLPLFIIAGAGFEPTTFGL